MPRFTNVHDIALPVALWLLTDDYDYNPNPNYISATTLLKSTKQIILGRRATALDREIDISDLIPARMGSAIHDSMEKAWLTNHAKALAKLGYPPDVIESIMLNPTKEEAEANPDRIHVYLEQRSTRSIRIDGKEIIIGGKFDQVVNGQLFDGKSTSVWGYLAGDKDDDHGKQGSIYRWLNPDIVTEDTVIILYMFTDWQRSMTRSREDYPKVRSVSKEIPLMTLGQTEDFITEKVSEVFSLMDAPEEQLPPCNDKQLWRSDPTFKYFADPTKTDGKSTKNFESLAAANAFWQNEKGGKGIVITKPGEVKACGYCAAYDICKQRTQYDV